MHRIVIYMFPAMRLRRGRLAGLDPSRRSRLWDV